MPSMPTSPGYGPTAQRAASSTPALPTGQERVRVLYEEYVHLSWLKQVWEQPVSNHPELEPCFAAAFHGIELAFLLMAQFVADSRVYVSKRPRVEAMALDIRAQCQLLGELVDGELEEEGARARTASLTQDFPFEGCPPTTASAGYSPGLAALAAAVQGALPGMSLAERNSMAKVALMCSAAFSSSFQRWSVGLGIEHQLNQLLRVLGLGQRYMVAERLHNLDYEALVRPAVAAATLTQEVYANSEDFFFRTIHLGTECWMFVANTWARTAATLAAQGDWHTAAARITQVAHILHYLGDHILTLTRMNLRDYLQLKVQLEGTSGAGSSQVRAIKGLVLALMQPLQQQLVKLGAANTEGWATINMEGNADPLLAGAMHVYTHCDKFPGAAWL